MMKLILTRSASEDVSDLYPRSRFGLVLNQQTITPPELPELAGARSGLRYDSQLRGPEIFQSFARDDAQRKLLAECMIGDASELAKTFVDVFRADSDAGVFVDRE